MTNVWFITGTSRGLGADIAKAAQAAGHHVVATGRRLDAVKAALGDITDDVLTVTLDVTQPDQVRTAVAAALERFGRIDVLVNNAGYGHLGVFEETSAEQIRAQ